MDKPGPSKFESTKGSSIICEEWSKVQINKKSGKTSGGVYSRGEDEDEVVFFDDYE